MAEKVIQKEEKNDLAILMPNREITIANEVITIREYSFKDAQTIHNEIELFTAQIVAAMNGSKQDDLEQADSIIMSNLEVVNSLISVSINKPVEFVESLSMADGYVLLDWWWVVNSGFFMNAATRKIIRNNAAKVISQNQ